MDSSVFRESPVPVTQTGGPDVSPGPCMSLLRRRGAGTYERTLKTKCGRQKSDEDVRPDFTDLNQGVRVDYRRPRS